jgi:hypothetical protein
MMDDRQRFLQTMALGHPDRPPLFDEGIRDEVIAAWHTQGLPAGRALSERFTYDRREELETDLEPRPAFSRWPRALSGLRAWRERLDPADPGRLPSDWQVRLPAWRQRAYPLMLRVHRGFFLTMGVYGWRRFAEVNRLLIDEPRFVHAALDLQGAFAARLAEKVLQQVPVDAAIFSEPIGGNHGPLISPRMYVDFVLRSYQPLLSVLKRYQVPVVILRTYANARVLIPAALQAGFNCLWACECNAGDMDYRRLRAEYGPQLRLIGGIDADILRQDQAAIRREVALKIQPLLAGGGFIPLADGRVREDVPFENYACYRRLLEDLVFQAGNHCHD